MKIIFSPDAWSDYIDLQTSDKQKLKKINILIKEIIRDPISGIGKPEKLKHSSGDIYSRRIDDKNRLVYRVAENNIEIIQCIGHYDDH